jgi:hypothetical protein
MIAMLEERAHKAEESRRPLWWTDDFHAFEKLNRIELN